MTKLFRLVTPICVGFAALTLAAPAARSQDLPSEGKFSITYTAVNPAPSKPIPLGDREITVSNPIMTAVNDAGTGLLHNMAGRCNLMTEVDKAAKTYRLNGACSYSDRAGDQVFEEVKTVMPQPLGGPIAVKGIWVGGTGKFAGLSGEFEIHPAPILASETLTQAARKKIGTYHITKQPVAHK